MRLISKVVLSSAAALVIGCGSNEARVAPSPPALVVAPPVAPTPPEPAASSPEAGTTCASSSDCGPTTPLCQAGHCVSCAGHACAAELVASEVLATFCLAAMEARPVMDSERARIERDSAEAAACLGRDPALARILDGIRAGSITVDLEAVRNCVARTPTPSLLIEGPQCDGFTGTGPDGAACASAAECASARCSAGHCNAALVEGAECRAGWERNGGCAAGLACRRVCARPSTVAGSPCPCGGGLVCMFGECRSRGAAGAQCSVRNECADGLLCADGLCAPPPEVGEPCTDPTRTCASGAVCLDGVCARAAEVGSVAGAAPCPPHTRPVGEPARCEPFAPLGASCGACAMGTACREGRCAPLPAIGEACTDRCQAGRCVSAVCVEAAVGTDCGTGLYWNGLLDPCGVSRRCIVDETGGRCLATVAHGAACDGAHPCPVGDLCSPSSHVCEGMP